MTNILGYGELMLRHTPVYNPLTINSSRQFKTNFGGSESNSLCFLASKGHNCTFLSAFPKNELGLKSKKFLENYKVKPKIIFDDNRLGVYYTIPGKNNNLSKIIYKRKDSSFSKFILSESLINKLIKDISYIIISGISPALSKICYDNIFKIIDISKSKGVKIIYDINYREKLWSLNDCKNFNLKILNHIDFLFTNAKTLSSVFNYKLNYKNDDFFDETKAAISFVYEKFNIPFIGMTVRVKDMLAGALYNGGNICLSESYRVNQVDRVGAGDVFLAATMNGFFNNWYNQKIISYSTSAFAISHTLHGDVNLISDSEIENFKINSLNRD